MPYKIHLDNDLYLVKKGLKVLGRHPTREKALDHIRAIESKENMGKAELKKKHKK